jgi:T5SS/PEP-CTERM-associated repeat protein
MKAKDWFSPLDLLHLCDANRIMLAVPFPDLFVPSHSRVGNGILFRRTPIGCGRRRAHTLVPSVHVLAAILAMSIFGAGPAEAQKALIVDQSRGTSPEIVPPDIDIKTAELFVGFNTTGLLNINTTGAVIDGGGFIGYLGPYNQVPLSTGQVTVTGPNATWTNSGNLYVGFSGTGTLTIQSGGTVTDTFGYIGYNPGSSGTVTVAGPNATWTNTSSLNVGQEGVGRLTIQSGGTSAMGWALSEAFQVPRAR